MAARGPGDCLEREGNVRRKLPAALFQLLAPDGVEPGRIGARGTDPERKRIPPIVETRVLHPDGQVGVGDVAEAGALAKHLASARESSQSPLIRRLAEGRGTGFGLTDSPAEIESEPT